MQDFINISNLIFTYENSAEPLFDSVSFQLHQGWTGFVGANGSGKTTLLKLITGALTPDSGGISFKGTSIYCEQRTDDMPGGLRKLLSAPDSSAYKLKEQLQLQDDWADRWNTLSHGERKRCQIACALYEEPDLLAIDEPSNHLDRHSKMFLFRALQSYRGVGLLVSHDRELLDGLCRNTIFVNPPDIDFRKCNYSTAEKEIETERERIARDYELAKRDIRKLKNRVAEERVKADNADRMRSKRDIDPKDRDAKGKINLARLTGRDGLAGKQHKKALSRLDSANEHKDSLGYKKQTQLGIFFNEENTNRYFPLNINSEYLNLGKKKTLYVPDLSVSKGEKIGIVGENGSGKSTLIKRIIEEIRIPEEHLIYIPQEVSAKDSKDIIARVHELNGKDKGLMMNILSRLGSEPARVLETEFPSPGETRKLLLAMGVMRSPALIILDEPTNHMDLPSIECLENALKEFSCPLLLVSHDLVFLKKIAGIFWSFENTGGANFRISVKRPEEI